MRKEKRRGPALEPWQGTFKLKLEKESMLRQSYQRPGENLRTVVLSKGKRILKTGNMQSCPGGEEFLWSGRLGEAGLTLDCELRSHW